MSLIRCCGVVSPAKNGELDHMNIWLLWTHCSTIILATFGHIVKHPLTPRGYPGCLCRLLLCLPLGLGLLQAQQLLLKLHNLLLQLLFLSLWAQEAEIFKRFVTPS